MRVTIHDHNYAIRYYTTVESFTLVNHFLSSPMVGQTGEVFQSAWLFVQKLFFPKNTGGGGAHDMKHSKQEVENINGN